MIVAVYNYFMQNIEVMIPMVVIMMSALIVFLGMLKPLLFNRVANKSIRCVLLSLTSVVLSFISVGIAFLIKQYNFDYYWICGGIYTCGVIVVYWLYENTQLRTGIQKIGSFVLDRFFGIIVNKVNKVADNTEEVGKAIDELFITKTESKGKKDELKNL